MLFFPKKKSSTALHAAASLIDQTSVWQCASKLTKKSRSAGLGDVYMLLANTFGVQGHWRAHSLASLQIRIRTWCGWHSCMCWMSVEAIGAYCNAMNQRQIHLIIVLLNVVITRQWDENLRIWEVVGQHLKNQLFVICITGISSVQRDLWFAHR